MATYTKELILFVIFSCGPWDKVQLDYALLCQFCMSLHPYIIIEFLTQMNTEWGLKNLHFSPHNMAI